MSIMVYRSFCCRNVSGVVLNPGYYALCECIVTGRSSCDVLYRWDFKTMMRTLDIRVCENCFCCQVFHDIIIKTIIQNKTYLRF